MQTMKTLEERVMAAAQRHGSNVRAIRQNINNPPSSDEVRTILLNAGHTVEMPTKTSKTPKATGKTLSSFRDAHDYAKRIREAIGEHCEGETYLVESELRQAADVPGQFWRRYADLPEFDSNKLTYKGQVLWGSATTIKKMRDIVKGL